MTSAMNWMDADSMRMRRMGMRLPSRLARNAADRLSVCQILNAIRPVVNPDCTTEMA
jgi:hypothetical protein